MHHIYIPVGTHFFSGNYTIHISEYRFFWVVQKCCTCTCTTQKIEPLYVLHCINYNTLTRLHSGGGRPNSERSSFNIFRASFSSSNKPPLTCSLVWGMLTRTYHFPLPLCQEIPFQPDVEVVGHLKLHCFFSVNYM